MHHHDLEPQVGPAAPAIVRQSARPEFSRHPVLALQRSIGNHAVARMLARQPGEKELEDLSYEDNLGNEKFLAGNQLGTLKSEIGESDQLTLAGKLGVDLGPVLRSRRRPRGVDVLKSALAVLGEDIAGTKESASWRRMLVQTAWELGVDLGTIVRAAKNKPKVAKATVIDEGIESLGTQLDTIVNQFQDDKGDAALTGLGVAAEHVDEVYGKLLFAGYKQDEVKEALGKLKKDDFKELESKAPDAQVEILLQQLRRATAGQEIAVQVKRIQAFLTGSTEPWVRLGATPLDREWVYTELRALGHSEKAIEAALQTEALDGEKETRKVALVKTLRAQQGPVKQEISAEDYPQREFKTEGVEDLVVESGLRSKEKGSTIDPNGYVERHFTPALMQFLLANEGMKIEIYEGKVGEALGSLAQAKFTEIRELSDNPLTDFRKFTARNPESKAVSLVVVGAPGRAYQREIAAHFVYYNNRGGKQIDPGRITHHRLNLENSAKSDFAGTLDNLQLDPDIVMMGNVEQVKAKLGDLGIEPVKEILAPSLYGVLYSINGKIVLSLKVEPYLYADRAGAFVEALDSRSKKSRTVIFTGTAGSLDKDKKKEDPSKTQVGDIVAPKTFAQTDELERTPIEGVENLATEVLNELGKQKGMEGIHTGEKVEHGAVDTILFEDNEWFAKHSKTMTIVEQEVAGIAKVIATSAKSMKLYAFFRVSDILGVQDFNENETHRTPERTKFDQGDVVLKSLEQALGGKIDPKLSGGSAKPETVSGKGGDRGSTIYTLGSHLITIYKEHLNTIKRLDPKVHKQLEDRIPQVLHANKDAGPEAIEKAILAIYSEYGLKSKVAKAPRPTTVTIKYEEGKNKTIALKLTAEGQEFVKDVPMGNKTIMSVTFENVPQSKTARIKATVDARDWEQDLETAMEKPKMFELIK